MRNLTSLKIHENKVTQRKHELMMAGNSKSLALADSIDDWSRDDKTSLERQDRI